MKPPSVPFLVVTNQMLPADVALNMLDRVSVAGLLLDPFGRVLRLNRTAERCLEKHTTHGPRQVGYETGWATQALRSLLGRGITIPGLLQAPRLVQSEAECSIVAYALSLPTVQNQPAETVLILLDLENCPGVDEETLRQVFGLTKAEARLAVRLACGESLQDIAEAFGIGLGTVRMQLKAIFGKTHTCRQAELVALLCRLALLPRSDRVVTPDAIPVEKA